MALAPFFDRVFAAAGRTLSVSRESLERQLLDKTIGIHIGEESLTGNRRVISELLVNLFSRLYPKLVLTGSSENVDFAAALAKSINPTIDLLDTPETSITVSVAGTPPATPALFAHSSGWVARLSSAPPSSSETPYNPYGAAAAAAFAAAETFRRIFSTSIGAFAPCPEISVSLLDYGDAAGAGDELPNAHLGEAAMFGLGAVANGALWTLGHHSGLTGDLHLVDDETVELSNLQRYALASTAAVGTRKTDIANSALYRTKLKTSQHAKRLEVFSAQQGSSFAVPTVCVSVDNIEGRRVSQALLPRLIVNGFTSETGLGVSAHRFEEGRACLACLYYPRKKKPSQVEAVSAALGLSKERVTILLVTNSPPSNEELRAVARHLGVSDRLLKPWRGQPLSHVYSKVVCGSVSLDLLGVGRLEAVPLAHQSVLAGILMAAELIKRSIPSYRDASGSNYVVWDDVLRPPPRLWTQPRAQESGCICCDKDYRTVFEEKWGTKHAG